MAVVVSTVTPPPAGAAVAFRVVDLDTGPVNLDVDDLELLAFLSIDGGPSVPTVAQLDDDELTVTVDVPPSATGSIAVVLAITSAELALTAAVGLAVLEVSSHPYGATFAGVEALVPTLTIDYNSTPSRGDVDRWLDELGARTAGRLGDLTGLAADAVTGITARAAGLVHLAAGAYVEDAAHPDRVSSQGDARYGAVLWARYEAGLAELEVDVDELLTAGGLGPAAASRSAAGSFPPPLFYRDRDIG